MSKFPEIAFGLAATGVVALSVVRVGWTPDRLKLDPELRVLEEKHRQLAGFGPALADLEARAVKVNAALWSEPAITTLLGDLPAGWVARPLQAEARQGITVQRYAFSKDAALRDYADFLRLLKKLEGRPSTRIDSVTLILNPDGRRFSTALVTATLPFRPAEAK